MFINVQVSNFLQLITATLLLDTCIELKTGLKMDLAFFKWNEPFSSSENSVSERINRLL